MSDGLTETSVDIPLATLNQTPAKHGGPLGRLQTIKNMVTSHFTPTDGGPTRLKADPRGAFVAVPMTTRNPLTGAASAVPFDNPELFAALDEQPLSICNAVPRVFNGDSKWAAYADKRVVTNILDESVFHTSQRTIQAQDKATKGGVTCCVWAEQVKPENGFSSVLYIGFKGSDKAWIGTPRLLYDPVAESDPAFTSARVIADDAANYFWVVFNSYNLAEKYTIKLFDLNGEEIDSHETSKVWTAPAPGYFDITKIDGGGCFLAQPLHTAAEATDGVLFSAFTQTAGTIFEQTAAKDDIHCRGPLAWVTNDLDDGNWYLATVGLGEGPGGRLWGYQIKPPIPTTNPADHEWDFNVEIPGAGYPDSLIGYVAVNADPDNVDDVPNFIASFTVLPLTANSEGAPFDPALRYSKCYSCDFEDTTTFIRQNNSTCQVSRAFLHDGEYYTIGYYQSGSGVAVTQNSLDVDWTNGDYMVGAGEQSIKVAAGDGTYGAPFVVSGTSIVVVPASGPQNIDGGGTADKVELITASGFGSIPDGTQLLKWTFKNAPFLASSQTGAILSLSAGASIGPSTLWDIQAPGSTTVIYTSTVSRQGGTITPGNFTTAGTVEVVSTTIYKLPLHLHIDKSATSLFDNGDITISGASPGGNNGTFTILNGRTFVNLTHAGEFPVFGSYTPAIWTLTTTQSTFAAGTPFTALIENGNVNTWFFASTEFTSLDVGAELVIDGAIVLATTPDGDDLAPDTTSNNGAFEITGTSAGGAVTAAGLLDTNVIAQIFQSPLPTASVHLPLDRQKYEFKLQDLTLDFTFYGALVFVRDATNESNNGLYKISFIDPSGTTFVAEPADGRTGQRSEMFPSGVLITIFFQNAIQPAFQSKWFILPLFDCDTANVGRFEDGIAFADWRTEGDSTGEVNPHPLHVTSVNLIGGDLEFILPYRAKSFTAGQPLVAPPNSVAEASVTLFQSTAGLKQFSLKSKCGVAAQQLNELFLPGPLTSVFTSSGFREQGISVAPEAPYLVTQEEISDDLHMTPGTTHTIIVTFEVTDENGNRVYCPPSPPLDFFLTGDNNCATYGGRLPIPFDTNGVQTAKHYGVTNHKIVGIIIQRTAYRGDLPTIQRFKITQDLNVNGLAPVSDINVSGFSFPDEFTWNYKDANPDVNILSNEILYTDKGFLPRFPAPASRFSATWQNRPWIVAYDGSLQPGGEFTEGDAPWYFPGFRFTFGNDKAVACAPMGNYLVVGCENSMWYIPQPSSFPDASGRNGTLPTPIQLDKIKTGCTGFMLAVDGGVAYSSTIGGVWLITPNFQNVYMSRDIQDQLSLTTNEVTSMQIDDVNRLHVATGTDQMFTYDQVVGTWYNWELPTEARLLSMINGQLAYQGDDGDGEAVRYDPETFVDFADEISVPILWLIRFADFSFAGVRQFKHCWAFQILGEYLGPHRLWAKIYYPDEKWHATDVRGPIVPLGSEAYLAEVNPSLEDASTFGLEIYNDFEDVLDPQQSASIELVAAAVGVESGMNQTLRRLT